MKRSYLLLFFLFCGLLRANMEISVELADVHENNSFVHLETKNGFDQSIKDARVWVFLMNDAGEVVGNKAQWIIGGDSSEQESLKMEQSQSFKIAVNTESKPTKAKVTFSRIILEDGTLVDPQTITDFPE